MSVRDLQRSASAHPATKFKKQGHSSDIHFPPPRIKDTTVLTRLTQLSLLAAILLSAGCAHHHHHDRDNGRDRDHRRWSDDDRRDRHYDGRHDHRRDDRRWRDND